MSIPYESTGRTRQKARTRDALVSAARSLLTEGLDPTVERAADRAGISRTSAYRYFPNRQALLVALYPEIGADSLLPAGAPDDAAQRLEIVMEHLASQLLAHGPELRAALRLSLEPRRPGAEAIVLRQGRAVRWIEDALEPLRGRLGDAALHRLALAIRAAVGIEPLVWLTDVAGLPAEDATALMRSTGRTLLRSALASTANP